MKGTKATNLYDAGREWEAKLVAVLGEPELRRFTAWDSVVKCGLFYNGFEVRLNLAHEPGKDSLMIYPERGEALEIWPDVEGGDRLNEIISGLRSQGLF